MLLTVVLGLSVAALNKEDEQIYRKVAASVAEVAAIDTETSTAGFSGTTFCVVVGGIKAFVTAKHVVTGIKPGIVIGDQLIACKVWTDDVLDCAVLKPLAPFTMKGLKISHDQPRVGEDCWLVGYPSPGSTVFEKVLGRGLINQYPAIDEGGDGLTLGFSCQLSPGDSGSPIVDSNGDVIGITCASFPDSRLSFGVPARKIPWSAIEGWLRR